MDNSSTKIAKSAPWVSASAIRKITYCPHSLELEQRGCDTSEESKLAMELGTIAHEHFNQQTQQDKRCFVASHLYGESHPDTQCLRDWRDAHLTRTLLGKCCVHLYYKASPWLVRVARANSLFDHVLRSVVTKLLDLIKRN